LKTGLNSICYTIVSNIAILLCFIPFLFLGWKKMRQVYTYCALGIYWLMNGLVNLLAMDFSHFAGSRLLAKQLNYYYELAETPLVFLTFALALQGRGRKHHLVILLLFIAGESALIHYRGYNFSTSAIILGSGLLLILSYSVIGLLQYLKKIQHSRFENSMVFVYASFLFSYGSSLIIYIIAHFHNDPSPGDNDSDSFMLYYISLLLSAAIAATGLWSYGIRKSRPGAFAHSDHQTPDHPAADHPAADHHGTAGYSSSSS
jgi:hypothetical protein